MTETGAGRVPLTLTVVIGVDGLARSSETVRLPVGSYWIRETDPENGTAPIAEKVRVEVTAKSTQDKPAVAEFTNNIDLGNLDITKEVTGAYSPDSSETYPVTLMKEGKYVTAVKDGTTYIFDELSDAETVYYIHADETLHFVHMPMGEYTVAEMQTYSPSAASRISQNLVLSSYPRGK